MFIYRKRFNKEKKKSKGKEKKNEFFSLWGELEKESAKM